MDRTPTSYNLRSIELKLKGTVPECHYCRPQMLITITAFQNKTVNESRKLETTADYKWQLSNVMETIEMALIIF